MHFWVVNDGVMRPRYSVFLNASVSSWTPTMISSSLSSQSVTGFSANVDYPNLFSLINGKSNFFVSSESTSQPMVECLRWVKILSENSGLAILCRGNIFSSLPLNFEGYFFSVYQGHTESSLVGTFCAFHCQCGFWGCPCLVPDFTGESLCLGG